VLVAGWFSWNYTAATAGDLLARDVACRWLERAGRSYDVANAIEYGPGVDWLNADADPYSEVLFVCGPVGGHTPVEELLARFPGARHIGLDLSMIEDPERWNPFDRLIERDSTATARPDLAFVADEPHVPVVGVVLVEPYTPEYPGRDRQDASRKAVQRLLDNCQAAQVRIDTRLPDNEGGLRSAAEVESLIARMDAVVTTRLHGLVLALKNGVPALAIDPVVGGAKISRQAETVGWPHVVTADALESTDLGAALEACLGDEARALARECTQRAHRQLDSVEAELGEALNG
jgi:hypothetical protein